MTHLLLSNKNNKTYFLSGVSKEHLELLLESRKTQNFNNFNNVTNIEGKNAIKAGSKHTAKGVAISSYVSYLKGYFPSANPRRERKIQFRDYTRPEEKQLEQAHLVSVCEDASSSAKSAIRAIKEDYIILWYKEN
jgi:hypothetical protein